MKNKIKFSNLLVLYILIIAGCATTPKISVRRPWNRVIESNEIFKQESKIAIKVQGQTLPLLGDERLLSDNIYSTAKDLLNRRGYDILEDSTDYVANIIYETTEKSVTL